MSEIVIAKLQEAGIEVVSSQQFSEGEKQFANYVGKLKNQILTLLLYWTNFRNRSNCKSYL